MQPNLQDPEVSCRNCGLLNDYNIILKSEQATAWCNGCGKFIKNVPYKPPTLYFGRYNGRVISSMVSKEEIEYLKWLLDQDWCKKVLRGQITNHLSSTK